MGRAARTGSRARLRLGPVEDQDRRERTPNPNNAKAGCIHPAFALVTIRRIEDVDRSILPYNRDIIVLKEALFDMSASMDGKSLHCDGPNCNAISSVPIALRPSLLPSHRTIPTPDGWLFILKRDVALHYCPVCAHIYLSDQRLALAC